MGDLYQNDSWFISLFGQRGPPLFITSISNWVGYFLVYFVLSRGESLGICVVNTLMFECEPVWCVATKGDCTNLVAALLDWLRAKCWSPAPADPEFGCKFLWLM